MTTQRCYYCGNHPVVTAPGDREPLCVRCWDINQDCWNDIITLAQGQAVNPKYGAEQYSTPSPCPCCHSEDDIPF